MKKTLGFEQKIVEVSQLSQHRPGVSLNNSTKKLAIYHKRESHFKINSAFGLLISED